MNLPEVADSRFHYLAAVHLIGNDPATVVQSCRPPLPSIRPATAKRTASSTLASRAAISRPLPRCSQDRAAAIESLTPIARRARQSDARARPGPARRGTIR